MTATKTASATDHTAEAAPKTQFVHLHNHTHYSLLDGLQKIPGMLDRVQAMGMDTIAITDHGTLSGAIEFYNHAKKRGIKPIIGTEAYVSPRGMLDKNGKIDANPYHLILLAYNNTGYQNLMKLSTMAMLDGFYYKPRIDRAALAAHHEGLICLSACASGEIGRHILNGNMEGARDTANWYRDTFGAENYYFEIQDHSDWQMQKTINEGLFKLSEEMGIPLVVTADSHYSLPTDREAHEILLCVQTGKTMGDSDRMEMEMPLYVTDAKDIEARWAHRPDLLENTRKIADRCNVELEMDRILIPRFDVPEGYTEQSYLHELCWQGAMWRYGDIAKEDMALQTEAKARKVLDQKIVDRIEYELSVISKMGYEGYFLIVADFINWGKNRGIVFGPGRGSAAGSIVAYVMNITDLDPIPFDLLFERFLNPDRISMPDVDIDIQDTRRGEVIEYVTEKYGEERVAQIITFGTMAARNAVRDTGRALGMPYAEVDAIAKLIPQPVQGRHIPLAKSIVDDPDLRAEYQSNPRAKRLIDLAQRLEGTIRSNGVHAAGVVIAPEAIVNFTPLQRAQKGGISTQYSMNPVEQLGLLKMDFLGLSNLTIINNALRIIRKVHGKEIDIATIPMDDKKTYQLLSKGDTTGVFQLESAGMKRYLRELKPSTFDDIVAMVALYRPGPMQFIDDFIDRKHGRKKVTYDHPGMEAALGTTYGILVYQEQFMQISKDMCGFTGGQADTLRKAIGKKQRDTMAKMKVAFIDGMVENSGVTKKYAETFWSQLEAFADYCFNKSHSACYGLIAYQTAYLKANYPAAFMAALLTSNHDNIEKVSIEVSECQRMGIEVLPPDVNESFLEFSVIPDGDKKGMIRFGLSAVKNVGNGPIEAILAAREEGGPFSSVEDFAKRVNASVVNKKAWESLIKAGAMDRFGSRSQLLHNLDLLTSYASKLQKNALNGQIDIFGSLGVDASAPMLQLELPPAMATAREQLSWERELLGLYLSSHPLDDFKGWLQDHSMPIGALTTGMEGKTVKIGGMITTVRKIVTRNGATMAFVGIEDVYGSTELIVFPKAYEQAPQLWEPDKIILTQGKVSSKDREGRVGEIKVMVDGAKEIAFEQAQGYKAKKKAWVPTDAQPEEAPKPVAASEVLVIQLKNLQDTTVLTKIKDVLEGSPGTIASYVVMPGPVPKKIRLPFQVEVTDELIAQLRLVVNGGQVVRHRLKAVA